MQTFDSFADIIAAWPSAAEFAADHEIETSLAAVWKHRNSIPSTHWDRTVAGAAVRCIGGVSYELLTRLARERIPTPRSPREAETGAGCSA